MTQTRSGSRRAPALRMSLLLSLLLAAGALQAADEIRIRQDSPERYDVVRGDTLWDIAGRFLEEPWRWPEVWRINPQIENPDLIYPGDVIELSYENGEPVLRLSRREVPAGLRTGRLSPQVRREAILSPIPAIALDQISAYLSDNSVLSEAEFATAPYLLAAADGRRLIGSGDEVYGRGAWQDQVAVYDIVREGRQFRDPDSGGKIGIEALAMGSATLKSVNGERAILQVVSSSQEIKAGDRLVPRRTQAIQARYLPEPPEFAVDAAIVSIGTGQSVGGRHDTLVLNRGEKAGLAPGHLLEVREPDKVVTDEHGKLSTWQKLKRAVRAGDVGDRVEFPGDRVATALVYRVFEDTSLALVLSSDGPVRVDDRVVTP